MKPDFKASGFSSNVWSVNQSSPTRSLSALQPQQATPFPNQAIMWFT